MLNPSQNSPIELQCIIAKGVVDAARGGVNLLTRFSMYPVIPCIPDQSIEAPARNLSNISSLILSFSVRAPFVLAILQFRGSEQTLPAIDLLLNATLAFKNHPALGKP